MSTRIAEAFTRARTENRGALMPYITAGDPDLTVTASILHALERAGADLVELGMPYSDPVADGPVIQDSAKRALAAGARRADIAAMIRQVRAEGLRLPLVIMTCYAPIMRFGPTEYAAEFAAAGADGVLVTDLPPSEAGQWLAAAAENDLKTVFLVAPNAGPEQIQNAAAGTTGFIYALSRKGVTGTRSELPPDLPEFIARIRSHTDLPVAVGFGISTAEHVRGVCDHADGAVVGSALVKVIAEYLGSNDLVKKVEEFTRELAAGLLKNR